MQSTIGQEVINSDSRVLIGVIDNSIDIPISSCPLHIILLVWLIILHGGIPGSPSLGSFLLYFFLPQHIPNDRPFLSSQFIPS